MSTAPATCCCCCSTSATGQPAGDVPSGRWRWSYRWRGARRRRGRSTKGRWAAEQQKRTAARLRSYKLGGCCVAGRRVPSVLALSRELSRACIWTPISRQGPAAVMFAVVYCLFGGQEGWRFVPGGKQCQAETHDPIRMLMRGGKTHTNVWVSQKLHMHFVSSSQRPTIHTVHIRLHTCAHTHTRARAHIRL